MTGNVATRSQRLSREESLRLLEDSAYVGRVGFTLAGRTTMLPVNYLAEGGSIFFGTSKGSALNVLREGTAVAFEVDASRPLAHAGWSVLVHGTAREVTDPLQLRRLERGPLHSWAVPEPGHWIRISVEDITGRSIPEA